MTNTWCSSKPRKCELAPAPATSVTIVWSAILLGWSSFVVIEAEAAELKPLAVLRLWPKLWLRPCFVCWFHSWSNRIRLRWIAKTPTTCSGCSTMEVHMPDDREVVGLSPTRCWAFSRSHLISSVPLIRFLMKHCTPLIFLQKANYFKAVE